MKYLILSLLLLSASAFATPTVELDEFPHSPIVNHHDSTIHRGHPDEFTVRAPWIHGSYSVKNHFPIPITVVSAEFLIYDNGSLIYDVSVDAPNNRTVVKPGQSFTFHNVYLDNLPKMFDAHVRYQIRYRVTGFFGTPDAPRSKLDVFTDFTTL